MAKKLKLKSGFTIIEVTLVLAITALLASGIMVGTSSSIARQRYNDAMNGLVSFFRQAYSEVINVQNVRTGLSNSLYCSVSTAFDSNGDAVDALSPSAPGRADCAIYGKLLTIGEIDNENRPTSDIHSYDIIGRVFSPSDQTSASIATDITTLEKVGANVLTFTTTNNSQCTLSPAGNATSYNPLWGVHLETTSADSIPFRGAILIFRSPLSGSIQTYYIDYSSTDNNANLPINISRSADEFFPLSGACNKSILSSSSTAKSQRDQYLTAILEDDSLRTNETSGDDYLTLCAASDDLSQTGSRRRGIRILKGGHNATAIELLNNDILRDGEENPCR